MHGKNRVLIAITITMVLLMLNTASGETNANMAVTTSLPVTGSGSIIPGATPLPVANVTNTAVTSTAVPGGTSSQATATQKAVTSEKTAVPASTSPVAKTAGFEIIIMIAALLGVYGIQKRKK